jgi:hypothetical protein
MDRSATESLEGLGSMSDRRCRWSRSVKSQLSANVNHRRDVVSCVAGVRNIEGGYANWRRAQSIGSGMTTIREYIAHPLRIRLLGKQWPSPVISDEKKRKVLSAVLWYL